jgi:hypothetical protein
MEICFVKDVTVCTRFSLGRLLRVTIRAVSTRRTVAVINGHGIAGRNLYAINGAALCAARRTVYIVDGCDAGLLIA